MLDTVLAKVRMMIEGDPGIRKVADDPVLSVILNRPTPTPRP